MEDRLNKLKSDLDQCNKRFGDLMIKIQDLLAEEQVLKEMA